jgi:hypothetical protein
MRARGNIRIQLMLNHNKKYINMADLYATPEFAGQ